MAFPPGTQALCRDCGADPGDAPACPSCGHRRIVHHPELHTLTIAHVDCDAFYASVEKRDRPELLSRPVIVGGGVRGVVSAACYVARIHGVRSAMPMFKALKACPDAVVIKPDFAKYTAAARQIRALMESLTPLVQPLSIDEAVLDLAGTQALHGAPPAAVLARFALEVEKQVGVTVSIGLARNRLMAKIAAGRDKPRGFCVIGQEAPALLAPEPVRLLPGIGPAFARKLESLGITRLAHLQALDEATARRRLGEDGPALVQRALGQDSRLVRPDQDTKSISAETTFNTDLADQATLEKELWRLAEKLANRLRASDYAAAGVVLKLKTAAFAQRPHQRRPVQDEDARRPGPDYAAAGVVLKLKTAAFAQRTRTQRLPHPTRLPDLLFETARTLLAREVDGTQYRLIGIGAQPLAPAASADPPDLADPGQPRRAAAQSAIDALRAKFGAGAVVRGRGFK